MVGIIQEQHPERARLFMQWKQMDWPLLWDPLNLLEVPYVPITLEIDEHGVIRRIQPPRGESDRIEAEFLDQIFEPPAGQESGKPVKPDLDKLRRAAADGASGPLHLLGNALLLWGGEKNLDQAIRAYEEALRAGPATGSIHFRLGVAYRRRYDSGRRQGGDFQKAVEQWNAALAIDPNNYIWRRRIQQYGPRLDKPYPFYDWVATARREIGARGGTPLPLLVEPEGAEFAHPAREFPIQTGPGKEPDPAGSIHRDEKGLIGIETTVVSQTLASGSSARVHVVFRPNDSIQAHWNNEADGLVFWVAPPPGWRVNRNSFTLPNPPETLSKEIRKIEFELQKTEKSPPGAVTIPAYALYYVCEDVTGTCLYRRQDVPLQVDSVEGIGVTSKF